MIYLQHDFVVNKYAPFWKQIIQRCYQIMQHLFTYFHIKDLLTDYL